jgi:hypothetical protein
VLIQEEVDDGDPNFGLVAPVSVLGHMKAGDPPPGAEEFDDRFVQRSLVGEGPGQTINLDRPVYIFDSALKMVSAILHRNVIVERFVDCRRVQH